MQVAQRVALSGRVQDGLSGDAVVDLEGVQEAFGAPTGVSVETVAMQEPGEGSDVPVSGQPGHAPGELGGELLHPDRDRRHRGWFCLRA